MNKLTIFDTHCHLADEKYQGQDIKKIIQEVKQAGVKTILNVGYDKTSNQKVIKQLAKFSHLFAALSRFNFSGFLYNFPGCAN